LKLELAEVTVSVSFWQDEIKTTINKISIEYTGFMTYRFH